MKRNQKPKGTGARGHVRARRKAKLKARATRNALKSSLIVPGPALGVATTRYDINEYGGTPGHIRHVGQIKKRRGS